MTIKEIESKIRSLALKSSSFKIGKTGLEEEQRLSLHKGFNRIAAITWSKDREVIDKLEAKMNTKFFNWKNNVNKNEGSAGKMGDDAVKYILYVISVKKRKKK